MQIKPVLVVQQTANVIHVVLKLVKKKVKRPVTALVSLPLNAAADAVLVNHVLTVLVLPLVLPEEALHVPDKHLLVLVLRFKLLLVKIVPVQHVILVVTKLVPNKAKKIVTVLVSPKQSAVAVVRVVKNVKMVLV